MKFMFVEASYIGRIRIPKKVISRLPKTIGLFFTLNFMGSLQNAKSQIEKTGRIVKLFKGKHTAYSGQIYGCNLERFEGVEAFLYVGDGLFHPKALILGSRKPVHVWDPISKKYSFVTIKIIEDELRRQRAAYASFHNAERIGVLVSTKPGQSYLKLALSLKKKYPDKQFFYIVMNTINFDSLEDFNFVQVWVNTACPRIGWDDAKRTKKPILDLGSLL